ncbi:MAG: shikimate dehydrogenase [Firmicutes bacterium]|nr:shikimate dehydrogenase [Bacillota bacterium]
MEISAKTKVFAVLGDPIAHSLSPMIQNYAAALDNTDTVYHAFLVLPENLENAVKGGFALGISGFNITVPHKKNVMKYLCGLDKNAEAIGAVNTLKLTENGYIGYNTDIIGAYYALETNGIEIKNRTVLILGAGGAGNACAAMAASRGAKKVYIANRTVKTAKDLAEHLLKYYDTKISAVGMDEIYNLTADIVINCTTLGFGGKADMTPINDVNWYKKAGVSAVFDAVYSPWETRFLREAKAEGIKTVNGFPMLVYQALAAREIWIDISYSPQQRQAVCDELTKMYLSK